MRDLVKTSYSEKDVTVLLTDLTGKMEAIDTEEREILIQSGKHYSEMLPVEYKPTEQYLKIYNQILELNKGKLAEAIICLGNKIVDRFKRDDELTIVSLARAGTPIGILLKRYIESNYGLIINHYSISIIRGKGIDKNALSRVNLETPLTSRIIFVDGWVGKGAIQNELYKSFRDDVILSTERLNGRYDPTLYTVSDPQYVNCDRYCGTREDFMMPNACLNATVNGLFSRTIRNELIEQDDYDGAVYYEDLINEDLSNKFIDTITEEINEIIMSRTLNEVGDILEELMIKYNISDVNKIKPGIGETIRVLLRRIPYKVLIQFRYMHSEELEPVIELCREKNVEIDWIEDESLGNYKCVGLIKELSDL